MLRLRLGWLGTLLVTFLCGCAANSRSSVVAAEPGPSCSFRSPTTCWTLGGRFPDPTPQPPVEPDRILRDSAPGLAALADSVRSSR